MTAKRIQKKINWSKEDRERHKQIRETFKDLPSIDDLVARGELSGQPMQLGAYLNKRMSAIESSTKATQSESPID